MIQTADQYVFLYRAIVEGILTMNTCVSLREFMITRKLNMDIKDQYKVSRINLMIRFEKKNLYYLSYYF